MKSRTKIPQLQIDYQVYFQWCSPHNLQIFDVYCADKNPCHYTAFRRKRATWLYIRQLTSSTEVELDNEWLVYRFHTDPVYRIWIPTTSSRILRHKSDDRCSGDGKEATIHSKPWSEVSKQFSNNMQNTTELQGPPYAASQCPPSQNTMGRFMVEWRERTQGEP